MEIDHLWCGSSSEESLIGFLSSVQVDPDRFLEHSSFVFPNFYSFTLFHQFFLTHFFNFRSLRCCIECVVSYEQIKNQLIAPFVQEKTDQETSHAVLVNFFEFIPLLKSLSIGRRSLSIFQSVEVILFFDSFEMDREMIYILKNVNNTFLSPKRSMKGD